MNEFEGPKIAPANERGLFTLLAIAPVALALMQFHNMTLLHKEDDEFKLFQSLQQGENQDSTYDPRTMRMNVPKGGTAMVVSRWFKILIRDFKGRIKTGDPHAFLEYGGKIRKVKRGFGQQRTTSYKMIGGFRKDLDKRYNYESFEGTGIEAFYYNPPPRNS